MFSFITGQVGLVSGSNTIGKTIEKGGVGVTKYVRTGSLAHGTYADLFSLATPYVIDALKVAINTDSATIRLNLVLKNSSGVDQIFHGFTPTTEYSNGEMFSVIRDWGSHLWEIVRDDVNNQRYVVVLKKPIFAPNGGYFRLYNTDLAIDYNIGAQALIRNL